MDAFTNDDCELCHIALNEDQEIVFENDNCYFLRLKQSNDKGQVLSGAGLIVPKAHKETVFDLSIEEWHDTYQLLRKVKAYIDDEFKPEGYNVGWNVGTVGGQHIHHAHLHVMPRYEQETMAGKGIRSHIKSNQNRLE